MNFFGKKFPAWLLTVALVVVAAGAATGLVLKDQIDGTTTIAVSQSILVVGATACPGSDHDEFLVTINDDHTEWAIHFEANNGDLLCYDLQLANEADQIIAVELHLWGNSPYTYSSEPLYYWTDDNHDGRISADEAVIDQRTGSNNAILETTDTVVNTGTADLTDFSANHWFFEGGGAYDDGLFSVTSGAAPEAIILDDGDGRLDAGSLSSGDDRVVTAGRADLDEDDSLAIGQLIFNDANTNGGWNSGEDMFLSVDGDAFYSTIADVLLDGDGSTTLDAGSAVAINVGDSLTSFDASDDIYYFDGIGGNVFDGTADAMWHDDDDDTRFATSGGSVSANTAATDLSSIMNPGFDIAVDGGGASSILLENSGAITAETLSTIGVGSAAGWAGGSWITIFGNNYIVDSTYNAGVSSTVTLIGDVGIAGDSLKGQTVIYPNAAVGGASGIYVAGGQTIGPDGKLTLNVDDGSGGLVDTSSFSAGDLLLLDNGGFVGNAVVMDTSGAPGSSSIAILGNPNQFQSDDWQLYPLSTTTTVNSVVADNAYLDSSGDIVTEINAKIGGATVTYNPANFANTYKFDSATTTSASAVVITDFTGTGSNVADDLDLGTANGGTEWSGGDVAFRDSGSVLVEDVTTGTEVVTSATYPFVYNDAEACAGCTNAGVFDLGEDVYEEESGGAGTYTSSANLPETIVYTGGTKDVTAGSAGTDASTASDLDDADNIMYRDTNHDGNYDTGEPLLDTAGDIDPGGQLTSAVTVLQWNDGSSDQNWPLFSASDMYQMLEGQANAVAGKDYKFADDDNGGAGDYDGTPTGSPPSTSTYGEAIIDDDATTDNTKLDAGEVVLNGYAMLNLLPMAISGEGSHLVKFEVPNVNDLGHPLEMRINIAIEDAAPTGFYTVYGQIRPLNV